MSHWHLIGLILWWPVLMFGFALPGLFHALHTICIELLFSELNKLYLNRNPDKYHRRKAAVSSTRTAMLEAADFWHPLICSILRIRTKPLVKSGWWRSQLGSFPCVKHVTFSVKQESWATALPYNYVWTITSHAFITRLFSPAWYLP